MSKPFEPPKHTQFSNLAIDQIMREVSPNAWKIITVAIRKTHGWHKQSDVISLSQFQELTGIVSRQTLVNAIKEVVDKKILIRKKNGISFEYELNQEYQYENCTDTSTETVPVGSTETVHTKDTIKETNKDKKIKGAKRKTPLECPEQWKPLFEKFTYLLRKPVSESEMRFWLFGTSSGAMGIKHYASLGITPEEMERAYHKAASEKMTIKNPNSLFVFADEIHRQGVSKQPQETREQLAARKEIARQLLEYQHANV